VSAHLILLLQPYDYPPNREKKNKAITRLDLATYFASYNSCVIICLSSASFIDRLRFLRSGVARVSALHNKWAIASPEGALCAECQELNALHSQSVDGAVIKIPDPLKTPPEAPEGQRYIVDLLKEHQETFEAEFLEQRANVATLNDVEVEEPKIVLELFLKSKKNALSEYEIFDLALRLSRKYKFDLIPYLPEIDISALGAMEKQIMVSTLELSRIDFPHIWNSLFQSDILSSTDLNVHGLDSSFSLQKLYSSTIQSQATFFEYLRRATQSYTRKLLLIRVGPSF
jgi:regulator of nonsense transcripts 1